MKAANLSEEEMSGRHIRVMLTISACNKQSVFTTVLICKILVNTLTKRSYRRITFMNVLEKAWSFGAIL